MSDKLKESLDAYMQNPIESRETARGLHNAQILGHLKPLESATTVEDLKPILEFLLAMELDLT